MPKSNKKKKYPYVVMYKYPDSLCDIPNCPYMFRYKVELPDRTLYLCDYHFINEFGILKIDEINREIP